MLELVETLEVTLPDDLSPQDILQMIKGMICPRPQHLRDQVALIKGIKSHLPSVRAMDWNQSSDSQYSATQFHLRQYTCASAVVQRDVELFCFSAQIVLVCLLAFDRRH